MSLILRNPRALQPAASVPANAANPLLRNLLQLWRFDKVGGAEGVLYRDLPTAFVMAASPLSQRPGGIGRVMSSTDYTTFGDSYRTKITNQLTWFWYGELTALPGSEKLLIGNASPAGAGYNSQITINGGTSTVLTFSVKTAGAAGYADSTSVPSLNRQTTIVATYDGANMRVYLDGVLRATTAKTGNVDTTAFSTSLNRDNDASGQSGFAFLGGVANRAWTQQDVIAFQNRPWSVLQAARRLLLTKPTTPTLSLPTAFNITATTVTPRVTVTF